MRILLVQPPKAAATIGGDDVFIYEPLALEYLAAGVRGQHDVSILDLRLGGSLQDTLQEYSPDLVGITAYTAHVNVALSLFATVKAWNPATITVVGGHHASVAPEDFDSSDIDIIVLGEGINPLLAILARGEKRLTLSNIPGTAISGHAGLIITPPEAINDLDDFPFPDRRITTASRSRYYSEWMRPLASMRTSKGCPFRCNFCALWKLAGGRYLRRDPDRLVEELSSIQEPYVFFADDESLIDSTRMMKFARQIKEAGIKKKYFLYGRSDTIAKNPKLLEAWRSIGLERVFVGFEFFRDQDLCAINKGSTTADNESAAKILNDLGFEVYASFIVSPDFLREDFAAFGPYCRKLKLNFATFAVLTPLPGTELLQTVKSKLITHNYDLVDFVHTLLPTALPLEEFYEELYKLYKEAIPFREQLRLLKKCRWRDIPSTLTNSKRTLQRLRHAYQDYGALPIYLDCGTHAEKHL